MTPLARTAIGAQAKGQRAQWYVDDPYCEVLAKHLGEAHFFEALAIIGPTNGKLHRTVTANITEGWEAHRQFESTFAPA